MILSVDLGTTSITAIAVDTSSGDIVALHTTRNDGSSASPSDNNNSRSEWDTRRILELGFDSLREVGARIPPNSDVAAIGVTGQQHGMLLVDERNVPVSPLINWQDRRGDDPYLHGAGTFIENALNLVGNDARQRNGCRLANGYMGLTLFWLQSHELLPTDATATFVADYFASVLTEHAAGRPVTDPTNAAGSGLFNVGAGDWDAESIEALDLPRDILPELRQSGEVLGRLNPAAAESLGLTAGIPVCVAIGDHQASFFGSIADPTESVLVNIGTGGQVAARCDLLEPHAELEVRPFPWGGDLLVCAGLGGGRNYATLESFFRDVGEQLFGIQSGESLLARMNELAGQVPSGADGLECNPLFFGTRADPELRASWREISTKNFSPAHFVRAFLEGTAVQFFRGLQIVEQASEKSFTKLIGAGNGVRENDVLRTCLAEKFALPMSIPRHREEAAFGAALLAAVGAGVFPDFETAARLIRYD